MKHTLSMDAVRSAVSRIPEDGLTAARQAALAQLLRDGLPTTTHEDWKYTDLGPIVDLSNQWLAAGANTSTVSDRAVSAVTTQIPANWLVIRNGVIDADYLENFRQAGVELALLSSIKQSPELDAPLSGLNVALLSDGLRIQISGLEEPAETIGLLFIDSAASDVELSQARVIIELQDQSCASIIEYHASDGSARHYANSVVEMSMANGTLCNYVRVQDRNKDHDQTNRLAVKLQTNSHLKHAAFDLGGRLIRNDLSIDLVGEQSSADFNGLYLAGGKQHIDNHTRVDHRVGPARSEQEYRGILGDSARCVWNGKAIVHRGADGTDASQANHNLLLSRQAEVDAKPELEIYTDDVKASHGTTVGELDKNALFYLRTRGLAETAAQQLLIRAFAQKIVTLSPITAVQEIISNLVADRVAELIAGDIE